MEESGLQCSTQATTEAEKAEYTLGLVSSGEAVEEKPAQIGDPRRSGVSCSASGGDHSTYGTIGSFSEFWLPHRSVE